MSFKYEYLLKLFPDLSEYVDDFDTISNLEKYNTIREVKEDSDYSKLYLSKEEYEKLSIDDRNQKALNNYIKGKKTNWQIGRDYELFCGQYYENRGWGVQFYGMEKKLEDLGRDLIAKKGNEVLIIQCKYWAKSKLIHEKHILQLYATSYIEELTKNDLFTSYKPVFITNTSLSETALKFAKVLKVEVINLEMSDFPRIKCNVTRNSDGTLNKIYHLPFDQQYDMTQIKNDGEFYAKTVQEASEKGFRRAFKFRF